MNRCRIAWIGLGRHTQTILYGTLWGLPVEVAAVCDSDLAKAKDFAGRNGVRAAYADFRQLDASGLDAVICVSAPQVHYEVAKHFLPKGIPVFVEKTPCENMEQALELARLEREGVAFIQTGFNRRFATGYVMAKKIIEEPAFGAATMFFSKFNAGAYRDERTFLTNHLIHHLDLARFFLGELEDLYLRRIRVDGQRMGFQLSARSETGCLVAIQSSSLQDIHYPMERVEITGIGSCVIVDNMKSLTYHRPATEKSTYETAAMEEGADALCWQPNLGFPFPNTGLGNEDEMRHFIRCVMGKDKPRFSFADTSKTMELLEEVLRLDGELD